LASSSAVVESIEPWCRSLTGLITGLFSQIDSFPCSFYNQFNMLSNMKPNEYQYTLYLLWIWFEPSHPLISIKLCIGGGRWWNSSVGSRGESCGSWIYWFTCSFHFWRPTGAVHATSFSECFYVFLFFRVIFCLPK